MNMEEWLEVTNHAAFLQQLPDVKAKNSILFLLDRSDQLAFELIFFFKWEKVYCISLCLRKVHNLKWPMYVLKGEIFKNTGNQNIWSVYIVFNNRNWLMWKNYLMILWLKLFLLIDFYLRYWWGCSLKSMSAIVSFSILC